MFNLECFVNIFLSSFSLLSFDHKQLEVKLIRCFERGEMTMKEMCLRLEGELQCLKIERTTI